MMAKISAQLSLVSAQLDKSFKKTDMGTNHSYIRLSFLYEFISKRISSSRPLVTSPTLVLAFNSSVRTQFLKALTNPPCVDLVVTQAKQLVN